MQDDGTKTYITNSIEIAAHVDNLAQRRTRGDLKISGAEEVVRVIFLGHSEAEKVSYVMMERLVAIGGMPRLDIGKDVSVVYSEAGATFYFSSKSIDIEDRDGCIRLALPTRIVKNQKRRFFRAHPTSFQAFDVVVNTEMVSEKCTVADISAGGLAFVTTIADDLMGPGTFVVLEFCLPDGFMVKTNGILRSHTVIPSTVSRKKYRCGVEFVDIRESIQDRIIRFVFNLQKEEIKRRRDR